MKVHCFFEQSGTFKNEFIKLGFYSEDYDLLNDFGQTDNVIDLFSEIEKAYVGLPSIFDFISTHDLIFAFFPCIRFSNQSYMIFQCTQKQLKHLTDFDKIHKVMDVHLELSYFYNIFCKLCCVCLERGLRLIIENPYSQEHYLTRYFPIKPKVIDLDRTINGDILKKPTQYWFINLEPKQNVLFEPLTSKPCNTVSSLSKVERSLISSEYAYRFIKTYIID